MTPVVAASCAIPNSAPAAAADAAAVVAELRAKYAAAGQQHVFAFFDDLDAEAKAAFVNQLSKIDPVHVNDIFKAAMAEAAGAAQAAPAAAALAPIPSDVCVRVSSEKFKKEEAACREAGLRAIRGGKVALLLLAGGQGTRLGSSAPKGCYDIGLPSKKSLFQIQAERLRRVVEMAGADAANKWAPWLVMVSAATRGDTVAFFEKHDFFGLPRDAVTFFEQGALPALDAASGKFLLEAKGRLAAAPDGNGGIYRALATCGLLARLRKQGVEYVHAYCVDNCLVKVLDPVFLGYAIARGADCATKTVAKLAPDEPVGVLCLRDGKYAVAEYSELPAAVAAARASDGALQFGSANIANHVYSLAFLERVAESVASAKPTYRLNYHVAHKKVPCIDMSTGQMPSAPPAKPNGVKLELFIFDVFPLCAAGKFAVLEGRREDEFSPLKNKTGVDSPATSRRDIMAQGLRYLAAAGAIVEQSMFAQLEDGGSGVCEISPLVSYAGENLESYKGRKIAFPIEIKGNGGLLKQ